MSFQLLGLLAGLPVEFGFINGVEELLLYELKTDWSCAKILGSELAKLVVSYGSTIYFYFDKFYLKKGSKIIIKITLLAILNNMTAPVLVAEELVASLQ